MGRPCGGTESVAAAVRAALADGAEREADYAGWLVLRRPDGRRLVVAPRIVAELDAAGLLPPLPAAGDDPLAEVGRGDRGGAAVAAQGAERVAADVHQAAVARSLGPGGVGERLAPLKDAMEQVMTERVQAGACDI
jgi:hypothetical protein